MKFQNYIILIVILGFALATIQYNRSDYCYSPISKLYLNFNQNINYGEFEAPVIGILTQSLDDSLTEEEFIAASYVKFIESGGGRVIPIRHTMNEAELEKIFYKINGLLITGGHQKLYKNITINQKDKKKGKIEIPDPKKIEFTKYQQTVAWFLEKAEFVARKGDYFPIFAICLGHEALLLATEPNYFTIQRLDTNITYHSPLAISSKDFIENTKNFWYDLPYDLKISMQKERIFYYHHKYGTPKDWYDVSEALQKKFMVLTYATDNQNRTFITSYQHRRLPIFAVQFHPEKNAFEWKNDANRSPKALAISHYLGHYFIDKCRQNHHKFTNETELKNLLMYNFDQSRQLELFSSIFIIPKDSKSA